MKGLLFLILVITACERQPTAKNQVAAESLQDSLKLQEQAIANEIEQEADKAEDSLALFLQLIPPRTTNLDEGDTLITFLYDYSFSGWIDGKYIQLYKTKAGIQCTQVFYTNTKEKGGEGFELVDVLTGMKLGKIYANNFQQTDLDKNSWKSLMNVLKGVNFFGMGKEACGRMVMDGTFTSLVFHSKSNSHKVERHNCPDEGFYQLTHYLENLLE